MVDYLAFSHQPSTSVLVARWLRTVTPEELRQGYQELLSIAALYKVRYWLLDLRRRGPISAELTQWVKHTFFPNAAQELQGCLYLSYFVSPDHLELLQQAPEQLLGNTEQSLIRLFTDERQATEWLHQTRLQEQAA
ncbi:hypothetical protein [Hymenobacter sp. BT730]|uniref:hypothetical protein n=1 Tax=Hymenobacter sp. BT730 TaxID=3063332 RepID=UPI0026DFFAA2|nr:hypothetical protein [Hymenobacter sp. BT730]